MQNALRASIRMPVCMLVPFCSSMTDLNEFWKDGSVGFRNWTVLVLSKNTPSEYPFSLDTTATSSIAHGYNTSLFFTDQITDY